MKLDILNEIPPQVNEIPQHFIHEIKSKGYDVIGVNLFLPKLMKFLPKKGVNFIPPILLAALPNCLVQLVESMQKTALRIIFPDCSYESALVRCDLPTLLSRRDEACRRFISNIKESGFLSHLLPQPTNVAHGYGLRSGFSRSEFRFVRTDHLSNFVTHSYNRI